MLLLLSHNTEPQPKGQPRLRSLRISARSAAFVTFRAFSVGRGGVRFAMCTVHIANRTPPRPTERALKVTNAAERALIRKERKRGWPFE